MVLKKIKVAIFGTGFMGRVHTESLRRLGNVDVVAVAGSTGARARKFADEVLYSQKGNEVMLIKYLT